MIVVPGTSTVHAETFARALGVSVSGTAVKDDWAILVGGSPNALVKEFRELGTKVACYWIGSDSMNATGDISYRKNIPEMDMHICVHERIQKELKTWGVDAHVVYPCSRNYSDGLAEAKETLVGVYMPVPELYMFHETLSVVKENSDMKFVFYGAMFDMGTLPDNAIDAKRMTADDTVSIQDKMSIMLRLVHHDGFPVGGIEMKQRNRHVIENYDYPGFLYARTMNEVTKHLRNPENHRGDFGPWPSWYREKCSPGAFKKNVERLLYAQTT